MFTDNVKIFVKAGNGGNGAVSFRHEKYVAAGGPDGGDGGRGGNVVLTVDEGTNTLLAFRYRHKFVAGNGKDGMGGKMHGASADDLVISVPSGTVVKDAENGRIIKDMSECGPFVLCKGGRGGWGNRHFATPTRQIPRFAKSGTKGEEREVNLELKMIADVGLIGFPNVGKSSILARISAARPKIGDYHFTTLSPNLGVVSVGEGRGFVCADIPGLIEGASDGAGLGHEFLRHVDRCRLLIHVVDISGSEGRDPVDDIEKINSELGKFSKSLASRPQILAANKCDLSEQANANRRAFEKYANAHGIPFVYISAAQNSNLDGLVKLTAEKLSGLPPVTIYAPQELPDEAAATAGEKTTTIRRENNTFYVEGEWLYNLMGQINFDDYESLQYFQRVLTKSGVIELLKSKGAADGDTVNIYDYEFDFVS